MTANSAGVLVNKAAVVTGASRGIGREIALALGKAGANVAVIYSGNSTAAEQTASDIAALGVKSLAYKCNVADFEAVKDTVEGIVRDFGTVDILVNNAGITADKLVMQMSEKDFDNVLSVNLKGAFNTIRHICPIMVKQRGGKIINISSVSGIMGNAGQANYAASKAGLIGLTKTVAKEYAVRNINCNVIAPGFIKTDMTDKLPDRVKQAAVDAIPLKKMGEGKHIAALAAFLSGPDADYITGEVIKVDGGLSM